MPAKKIAATPARHSAVPDRADQQQLLAPDPVDHRHRDHGEQQVRGADRYRLQIARDLAEAGLREDVVQVVENRVDAGELIEHRRSRPPERSGSGTCVKQRLVRRRRAPRPPTPRSPPGPARSSSSPVSRSTSSRFLARGPLRPASAGSPGCVNSISRKSAAGNRGDAELPAPLRVAESHGADHVIREIRQQDAEHDIELEQPDQPAAPLRRRDLRDVHRPQHRRAADPQAADEARKHQRIPVQRERATERRDQIQHRHDAQAGAPAVPVAGNAGEHRAQNRAPTARATRSSRAPVGQGICALRAPVAPAITAVSKPNSSPPSAATRELFAR